MATSTSDLVTVAGHNITVNAGDPAQQQAQAYNNMLISQGVVPETAKQMTANMVGQAAAQNVAETTSMREAAAVAAPEYSGPSAGLADWMRGLGLTPPAGLGTGSTELNNGGPAGDWRNTAPGWQWDGTGWRFNGAIGAQGGVGTPAATGGTGTAATPALNIPYGADFMAPMLQFMAQMLGFGENKRQFNVNTLADLQANPLSASEQAFRRAGMGLDPFSKDGNAFDVARLITHPTSAGGSGMTDYGNGQSVSVPDTLSGADLSNLAGMPNTSKVLQSFANTAGNPDIIQRSLKALVPALFGSGPIGQGSSIGFGGGTGI